MAFRFLTSGESHGEALTAVIDGVPAGLSLTEDHINEDLARRQRGYGRGGRMVGTFYRASAPDAAPFVNEGDIVKEDQVLCIIEAMKLMNEIESKAAGRIIKILVDNGQPVEYGQALFLIEPAR